VPVAQIVIDMARPTNQGLITEAGLFITTESGNYLVTESFVETQTGGRAKPKEIKKDSSELWEIGASIYSINDKALKETVKVKKYITKEDDINVIIGEDVFLRKSKVINENVIVKLLSNRIKE